MAQEFTQSGQQVETNPEQLVPRRSNHGSVAWSVRDGLRQPQDGEVRDGALKKATRIADLGSHIHLGRLGSASPSSSPQGPLETMEPEDARLTGDTRSLMRRLMGLNITGKLPLLPAKLIPTKLLRTKRLA